MSGRSSVAEQTLPKLPLANLNSLCQEPLVQLGLRLVRIAGMNDLSGQGLSPLAGGKRGLLRADLVLEAVRVEAVEPAVCCFRLRIHQESHWGATRSGQSDIVGEVVRHPVHLPETEETGTGLHHHLVVEREVARAFLENDLAHVAGVNRTPAVAGEVNFCAAVLRFRHFLRRRAEALVSQV